MPNGATLTGRFPVPLRSSAPAEADLLKELEALKGVYGGINERLREWLLRGLKELEQRTQRAPSASGDAASALVAVATELNNSVAVSQHFLAMYALARETVATAPKPRTAQVRPVANPQPPAPPSQATSEASESSPSSDIDTESAAVEAPRTSWAHLKGLVGD